jgi:hypothetical protein
MKAALLLFCAGALLTGCATHSEEDIAAVRAAGVSPRVVSKLANERVLAPNDLIELRRKRVSDEIAIRHLDDVGVDYLVQRNDIQKLRAAGVRPGVINELLDASSDFVQQHTRAAGYWSVGIDSYDPWFYPMGHYPFYY